MLNQYIELLARSLRARELGDGPLEASLLDQLDRIWFQLSDGEISSINSLSDKLGAENLTAEVLESLLEESLREKTKSLARDWAFGRIISIQSVPLLEGPEIVSETGSCSSSSTRFFVHEQTVELANCHFASL